MIQESFTNYKASTLTCYKNRSQTIWKSRQYPLFYPLFTNKQSSKPNPTQPIQIVVTWDGAVTRNIRQYLKPMKMGLDKLATMQHIEIKRTSDFVGGEAFTHFRDDAIPDVVAHRTIPKTLMLDPTPSISNTTRIALKLYRNRYQRIHESLTKIKPALSHVNAIALKWYRNRSQKIKPALSHVNPIALKW